jgi:hypothetical protein
MSVSYPIFNGNTNQQQQSGNMKKSSQTVYSTSHMNLASKLNESSLLNPNSNSTDDDVKVQIYYAGLITVIYLNSGSLLDESAAENSNSSALTSSFSLESFAQKVRSICKLDQQQPFTIKWVDEEGDPCTITSQLELDEAIRLYYLNKEHELVIHVFANKPIKPGMYIYSSLE